MKAILRLFFLLLVFSGGNPFVAAGSMPEMPEDSIDIQVLYNGRAWRNLFLRIDGDQFFFNSGFVPGTVTLTGRAFPGQSLRLDTYNDELLILTDKRIILQLNKELIDEFTLNLGGRVFRFLNFRTDSLRPLRGFVNVLSQGTASLYVKYSMQILLADDVSKNAFSENIKIYLEKDGVISRIVTQGNFLRLFGDKKQEVRAYMKAQRIKFYRNDPESMKPAVDYFNSLQT